jgi:hypothetical protein
MNHNYLCHITPKKEIKPKCLYTPDNMKCLLIGTYPVSTGRVMKLVCRENVQDATAIPGDGLAAYYAHGGQHAAEPVFDESIGLTVEAMPSDVTMKSLWSVL